jgi:hypothetical protein
MLAFRQQDVCLTLCRMPSSECCAMAVRKSNSVLVPVMCIPCVMHQSNTELGVRCRATSVSVPSGTPQGARCHGAGYDGAESGEECGGHAQAPSGAPRLPRRRAAKTQSRT